MINKWLEDHENNGELPLYASVDIRDAGFKTAVVDTNLFPAGFNNLCVTSREDASITLKETILNRVPTCQRILIITEKHTRNKWYLENVVVLESMIKKAGFKTTIASFLDEESTDCQNDGFAELESASGKIVKTYCLKGLMKQIESQQGVFDLIILNNDLSSGIPEILQSSHIPIYPSVHAGWHARKKSHHFEHTNWLVEAFSEITKQDPWLYSCLFKRSKNVNINDPKDRESLADYASDLFKDIQSKYTQHNITEKPYIFLKSDSGTYGMGVMPIEDPHDILTLNRKGRNKLAKGKSAIPISHFILQEGVPDTSTDQPYARDICIYQINNKIVGGFYRFNPNKGARDNLNSPGMSFKRMCQIPGSKACLVNQDSDAESCGIDPDPKKLELYQILARIAGISAQKEIGDIHKELAQ
ncbi:MAG: glutamate--cysteine ligase [Candidatus Margulisbacteria bacterium]|nr:glutamate--cysteine ligase [Candidatus Margulisiibacteriota bacterium]